LRFVLPLAARANIVSSNDEGPFDHREALALGRTDVRRRDEAARLEDALDHDGLAARVA
jgi:hypothetical protein